MSNNTIRIDFDQLREALMDDAGTATFVASPLAMADLVAVESASPEELIRMAEQTGMDLRRFEVR